MFVPVTNCAKAWLAQLAVAVFCLDSNVSNRILSHVRCFYIRMSCMHEQAVDRYMKREKMEGGRETEREGERDRERERERKKKTFHF